MGYEVSHIYEEKESGFDDDRTELAKVLALTNADTDAMMKNKQLRPIAVK